MFGTQLWHPQHVPMGPVGLSRNSCVQLWIVVMTGNTRVKYLAKTLHWEEGGGWGQEAQMCFSSFYLI